MARKASEETKDRNERKEKDRGMTKRWRRGMYVCRSSTDNVKRAEDGRR